MVLAGVLCVVNFLVRGGCSALRAAVGRGAEIVAAGLAETLTQTAATAASGEQPAERRRGEDDGGEPVGDGEDCVADGRVASVGEVKAAGVCRTGGKNERVV